MTILKKLAVFLPLYMVWVGLASYGIFGRCTACLGPGPLQWVAILGYLLAIMIPMGLFLRWLTAVPSWMKTVAAQGQQAPATIMSVKETGMVINNTVAVIRLQLRVEPPNAAPFEVSQEKEVSMLTGLGGYFAGARVRVAYDPANKNHLIIQEAGRPPEPARPADPAPNNPEPDVTEKLQALAKLHRSGELSDAEFAAAKARLLA